MLKPQIYTVIAFDAIHPRLLVGFTRLLLLNSRPDSGKDRHRSKKYLIALSFNLQVNSNFWGSSHLLLPLV